MIITIATTKGGAAKTTTAMLLAEAAGRAGHSALVIDADPRGQRPNGKKWPKKVASLSAVIRSHP
ncbi:ParA family protein [Rothia nasimurium]|uniref:ParA family protein n=1 Tax=Rothia nasimurium TaxID=85336 RepID=UPI00162561F5